MKNLREKIENAIRSLDQDAWRKTTGSHEEPGEFRFCDCSGLAEMFLAWAQEKDYKEETEEFLATWIDATYPEI
jgi:hypothetical protein